MREGAKDTGDAWLTAKTKIALYADNRVAGTKIDVDTKGGVVVLRGKVDSQEAKDAAAEVARSIEGVREVKNELQVVAPAKRKLVEAKDDLLTKQVEKGLERDPELKDADVSVRGDAGVVTLTGKVPGLLASARASENARSMDGVRSVKNSLSVEKDK